MISERARRILAGLLLVLFAVATCAVCFAAFAVWPTVWLSALLVLGARSLFKDTRFFWREVRRCDRA